METVTITLTVAYDGGLSASTIVNALMPGIEKAIEDRGRTLVAVSAVAQVKVR